MIILLFHAIAYFRLAFRNAEKYKELRKNNIALADLADISWIHFIILLTISLYLINSALFFIRVFADKNYYHFYIVFYSILLILAGLKAIRMNFSFVGKTIKNPFQEIQEVQIDEIKSEKYAKYGLTESQSIVLEENLKKYMIEAKPYLNPDLGLKELAEGLDVFPHYMSQILNTKIEQNFYDFVNSYRIEEAKHLLNDPDKANFTILSIAFDCGFKTQSSFNKYFKSKTGLSPTEYRKHNNIDSL